jgi:hypothetical protein
MSEVVPENQMEARYVLAMGPELGRLCARFFNECVWLNVKWGEYVALFGTTPERVDMLNKTAGTFLWIVEDALWDNVLLHIARLTDPSKRGAKRTLTLQELPRLVAPELRRAVQTRLAQVLEAAKFARDWRNRRLAHLNLALALNENAKPSSRPAERTSAKHLMQSRCS